ncbi:MAG: hypothetical protein JWO92_4 [Chitinophagaceae bacterium]|nr:hypothetical protein [Chitinophagaceae bacterium]
MNLEKMTLVMIPQEELADLQSAQQEILQQLKALNTRGPTGIPIKHITAKEFMNAVRIKRTKFDQLVLSNKIKTIKKRRKIYVPISEVDRYFSDSSIQ